MAEMKKLMRDYVALVKGVDSHFDGQVKLIVESDDLDFLKFKVKPNGGLYKGGTFDFTMRLDDYPGDCPVILCLTDIFHPNINTDDVEGLDVEDGSSNICVNFFEEWSEDFTLTDAIQAVLFLFYHPQVDDYLGSYFEGDYDRDEFENDVRISLDGGTTSNGIKFEKNLDEVEIREAENGTDTEKDGNSNPGDVTGDVIDLADVNSGESEVADVEDDVKNAEPDVTKVETDVTAETVTVTNTTEPVIVTTSGTPADDSPTTGDVTQVENDVTNESVTAEEIRINVVEKPDLSTVKKTAIMLVWTKFVQKCMRVLSTAVCVMAKR